MVVACNADDASPSSSTPAITPAPPPIVGPPSVRFFDTKGTEVKEIIYTEQFSVRVDGLPPGAEVSVNAYLCLLYTSCGLHCHG